MRKHSRVVAEINYNAIDYNMQVMISRMTPTAEICAVVKADAYGHGALQIARHLQFQPYIWGFACATSEEAMNLRMGGISKPIVLLGYAFEESYEDMIDYDIRACIMDIESARRLSEIARGLRRKAKIHIAVDTGMGRIGYQPTEESAKEILEIAKLEYVEIEGIFTHFARADEPSIEPAKVQLERFKNFDYRLRAGGLNIPICHASNSAGIMRLQEANLDMVRAGITMYGLMPSDEVADEMKELKPVMRLVSHVTHVKTLPAGSPVSYGGTYVTKRNTRIATIPVGYADGYPRSLSNKGYVLIHGKKAPIVGRVCMDQFMVDVTELPPVKMGDEVVLLGDQGKARITAEMLGALSGRFNYELTSLISRRVPRNYLLHGYMVEQVDYLK